MYHVSPKGQVGKCEARIQCPFGDFENHHYPDEATARAAYESSMDGVKIPETLRAKEREEQKRIEKELKAAGRAEEFFEERRERAGALLDRDLPEVHDGHYVPKEILQGLGDQWMETKKYGEYIAEVQTGKDPRQKDLVLLDRDFREVYRQTLTATKWEGEDEHGVWINLPDPEAIAVREAQEYELSSEIVTTSLLPDVKRAARFRLSFPKEVRDVDGYYYDIDWDPKMVMTSVFRFYKEDAKKAKEGNAALPYATALSKLEEGYGAQEGYRHFIPPWTHKGGYVKAVEVVRALTRQDSNFKPDPYHQSLIKSAFPEGERPFIDYNMDDTGLKVQSWKDAKTQLQKLETEAGLS